MALEAVEAARRRLDEVRGQKTGVDRWPKLSAADAEQRLKGLSTGGRSTATPITKQFTFAGFPEAVAFVNRLVPEAEAADHHPDILINYKRVTLTYSTHSEGGPDREGLRRGRAWPIALA